MADPVEELESQLAAASNPRERVDLLAALSKELRDIDAQRAMAHAQAAYDLAVANPSYVAGLVLSQACLAESNLQLGRLEPALALALEALSLCEAHENLVLQAQVLRILNAIYEHLGDYPTALTYAYQALEISQYTADRFGEALALNLVGIVYDKLGDYRHALDAYGQALGIFEEAGRRRHVAILLNNIADACFFLGELDRALEYGQRSLQITRELGLDMGEATVLSTIGDIYLQKTDYTQALACFGQALDLARRLDYRYIEMCALISMGKVHGALQQPAEAIPLLEQAVAIATEIGARNELCEGHQTLAEMYKQCQDFRVALEHYERYRAVKEAVFSEAADKRIRNLQVIHHTETARKEAEIYRLRSVELEQEITARRQAEEKLRQYAEELEKQNAELEAFAHTVAHDLKNPLNALRLASSMSEYEFATLPQEEQYDLLRVVDRCGQRIGNIIDELLLLTSVRGQQVEPQPLEMGLIVERALDRLYYLTATYKATVRQPAEWPVAMGYGPWIEEVWVNYVSNALKYGGQPPRVEIGANTLDADWVRFWVCDNGAGLTEEERSLLFAPFERLHQVRTEGHGLGLSIVRRIVEKLGGRVGVDPDVPVRGEAQEAGGPGSTFYFDLPRAGHRE
jgi:signal transduction histidine kinase/predicted negative regulator of RcsB-dependent stress response